jgi:hypothetical protein
MASELRVNTLKDAAGNNSIATSFVANGSAKGWVNFNGVGTIAIRDSFSVSSIDDDGTGLYSYNLSSAMSNANYNLNSNASRNAGTSGIDTTNRAASTTPENTSSVLLGARNMQNGAVDVEQMHGNIHGDLA